MMEETFGFSVGRRGWERQHGKRGVEMLVGLLASVRLGV
jgi:hypothetical protein